MQFTLDARSGVHLIQAYSATELRIGEHTVRGGCILTARDLITDWHGRVPGQISEEDLEIILALEPELIVLGTVGTQRLPAARVRAALGARRVGLEAMELGAACRTFNILVQEERRVVAVLLLERPREDTEGESFNQPNNHSKLTDSNN